MVVRAETQQRGPDRWSLLKVERLVDQVSDGRRTVRFGQYAHRQYDRLWRRDLEQLAAGLGEPHGEDRMPGKGVLVGAGQRRQVQVAAQPQLDRRVMGRAQAASLV